MRFTFADVKTLEPITDKVFESAYEAKQAYKKLEKTKGVYIQAIGDGIEEEKQEA